MLYCDVAGRTLLHWFMLLGGRIYKKCAVTITLCTLHEAAYQKLGTNYRMGWLTHGSSRRSEEDSGYGNTYSTTLRTGFSRRRMIMWISAARPCSSFGYDPPPACVVSRLVTTWRDSSPTWLVGCQRAPCPRFAPELPADTSSARRQLRSARTHVVANNPQDTGPVRRHESIQP
jgi:hypothetical protein